MIFQIFFYLLVMCFILCFITSDQAFKALPTNGSRSYHSFGEIWYYFKNVPQNETLWNAIKHIFMLYMYFHKMEVYISNKTLW